MFWIVLIVVLGLCAVFCYNKWIFQHWEKLNVPHPKPHLIFGNVRDVIFSRKSIGTVYREIYNFFSESPYVGFYLVRKPAIMVRDPEIIRDVLVKDFASFQDNDLGIDEKKDPIFGCNPFNSRGEVWKTRRARHTPHYTSGKVKSMLPVLNLVGDKMQAYLKQEIKKSGGRCCMDANELTAKFTIDNVANCALGISGRTFETNDAELLVAGRKILNPEFFNNLNSFLVFFVPSLASILPIHVIPTDVTQTFRRLVTETLKYRKENKVIRNDFFDNVKEVKGEERSIDDIMVMVGGFYLDGFITTSIVMSFVLYELAANPDCQAELRKEIDEAFEKNTQCSYDLLQEMPYLEAVVSETLRKYPPLTHFTRLTTKEFTFPPCASSSKGLTIPVDTPVIIPTMGLHYDAKYFPEPEKFAPDRFLGENKDAITKFTYLPFSDGPRICIGMRFALLQLKVGLVKLISEFEISLNRKTTSPIEIGPGTVLLTAKGGVWIDFRERRVR